MFKALLSFIRFQRKQVDKVEKATLEEDNTYSKIIRNISMVYFAQNAEDVMLPERKVVFLDVEEKVQLQKTNNGEEYFLLYKNQKDNIIGFGKLGEIKNHPTVSLEKYTQFTRFISPATTIYEILEILQESEILIVVDEWGGFMGIVTMFSCLQRYKVVVKRIFSNRKKENFLLPIQRNTVLVRGATYMNTIASHLILKTTFEKDITLDDWVREEYGTTPNKGEILVFKEIGLRITVLEMNFKSITLARLSHV